jgi:hypothetical protein
MTADNSAALEQFGYRQELRRSLGVNFGALFGFLMLHVAVIVHYVLRLRSRDWLRHPLMSLIGFAIHCLRAHQYGQATEDRRSKLAHHRCPHASGRKPHTERRLYMKH